ncbi:MAG: cobyric acid synthase CobQ, partial [Arcobacter sp.]
IRVGVISYPYMSNYNDFEPLIADSNINLEFIESSISLDKFDLIILPGSKLVIKDLQWLKSNGLFKRVKEYQKTILGLCGGYEMMFKTLDDKYALENSTACIEEGFGFIDDEIVFEKEKVLKKASYDIFDCEIEGFEIHHGVSEKYPISYETGTMKGTFIHAIFDNDNIRTKLFKTINSEYKEFDFKVYKKNTIDSFISNMKNRLDVNKILENINE